MAQNFPETAHLRVDRKEYADAWERIFGQGKEHKTESHHYKIVNGDMIEISEQESKRMRRHPTSGMCGEIGLSEPMPLGGIGEDKEHKEWERHTCLICGYNENRYDTFCENC